MTVFGGRRKGSPGILLAAIAGFSLLTTTAANAVINVTTDAVAFAGAVTVAPPSGGAFVQAYDCKVDDPLTTTFDETRCPMGVSDTPLAGFPTSGGTYGILSTGNVAFADDANTSEGTSDDWGVVAPGIGPDVHDYQVARIDLPAATTSCLAFDFRFLSDEYVEYVDRGYNDAFVAQLNTWGVTIDPATQAVNAPGNFAGGAGDVISVDSSGPSAMTATGLLGTTYDGATPLLTARVPVTPGSANSVHLTLFDQGDGVWDSAVFVDNMRYEDIDPKKCKSLALDPSEGTIGVSLTSKPKLAKNLSQLTVPVSCDLPPGPVSCSVTAVASFIPTQGRVMNARAQAMLAGVTLTKVGSATIAPNTNGTITMKTTRKGIDAVKAAIKKPAKLKAKAQALLKKAKQLRAEGKIAQAKELEAKAAKLITRAKKLARKPLGVIKTTITNPSNGATQSFKTILKRP
jgi:hypothetical protein